MSNFIATGDNINEQSVVVVERFHPGPYYIINDTQFDNERGWIGNFQISTTPSHTKGRKHLALIPPYGGDSFLDHEAAKSQAKLFAASADMYQALKDIIAYEDRGREQGEPRIPEKWYNQAKATLKKATE